MQIEIVSVTTSFTKTAKGGYEAADVKYVSENGQERSKKVMSFANPAVYKALKDAVPGSAFEVTEKTDGQYTNWSSASLVDVTTMGAALKSKVPASKPYEPQYETRDERNARQRLIVRQSCLSNAIALIKGTENDLPVSVNDAIGVANELVAWVYEAPGLIDMPNDDLGGLA